VKWIKDGKVIETQESVTTDEDGEATITLPPGNENAGLTLWVKGGRTLAVSKSVGTIEPESTIDVGELRGGDADNSNVVDIRDFFMLAASFQAAPADPRFDPRADFNNDGIVDIRDFFILADNFNRSGAQLPAEH